MEDILRETVDVRHFYLLLWRLGRCVSGAPWWAGWELQRRKYRKKQLLIGLFLKQLVLIHSCKSLYYYNEAHMWSDKLGIDVIFLHKLIFRCWSVGFVCLCEINCVKRCSPHHSHSLSFPWLPALVSVGDGLAPPSLCRAFLLYEWNRFTSPSQGQGWECVSMWVCVCFLHIKCLYAGNTSQMYHRSLAW